MHVKKPEDFLDKLGCLNFNSYPLAYESDYEK